MFVFIKFIAHIVLALRRQKKSMEFEIRTFRKQKLIFVLFIKNKTIFFCCYLNKWCIAWLGRYNIKIRSICFCLGKMTNTRIDFAVHEVDSSRSGLFHYRWNWIERVRKRFGEETFRIHWFFKDLLVKTCLHL